MPTDISEEAIRLQHLENIRTAGIEPYPAHTKRTHTLAEAREAGTDSEVIVAGRIVSKREMGKIAFCHLKDMSGRLQAVFSASQLDPEKYKFFIKQFDLGDFVSVRGKIFVTKAGEVSVMVDEFDILTKTLLPLPEKFHGLSDIEIRYRQRYLDLLANEESVKIAKARSLLVREIRNFFDGHGFYEVETPVLQTLYGGALARPFETHHNALDIPLYLRIAPELYLKRLVVGGLEKVYEVAKCFRNEGIDQNHNPEFTQIEFYWAYADYQDLMDITEELLPQLITKLGLSLKFETEGQTVDFTPPYPRVTMRALIQEHAGIDIEDYPTQEALYKKAIVLKIDGVDKNTGRGKLIDEIYKVYARPKIVNPIFMIDHPVELSPLAKRKPNDPRYVERLQLLCVGGNELCNGFSELNDPIDQEERFREQERLEAAGDDESMPFDEDYVTALKHGLPPTAGLGMGIDRLVKLLMNAENLKEVILFPTLKPTKGEGRGLENTGGSTQDTTLPITREEAWELVKKHTKETTNLNHYLESEAVMRALAERLGENAEYWGMAGLLHDIDWEMTANDSKQHLTIAPRILKEAGFDDNFIETIVSHGYGCDCADLITKNRETKIQYALASAETVTGLVYAAALMRPDKINSLEVKSLLKKFKDKSFAAKVNREIIRECEKIGLELSEFLELSLNAIKKIAGQIGLN